MEPQSNSNTGHKTKQRSSKSMRRSRLIFITIMILTTLAIIWPGHALFSSATPLIFGFPLSFAWIILWVIIGFSAMLGLYIYDSHDDKVNGETN